MADIAVKTALQLRIKALAGVNPLDIVPAADLAALKARDPSPFLQAFSICHEGIANPTVLGETARPITWLRQAVETIKRVVVKGVKFFFGHNADSSTEGREALGEVVASGEREIDGKLHHVVVGYFPNRERVADLDICSQESDWDLLPGPAGYIADRLIRLTGIALSSSKVDRPAFPGAVRLGMVQAFEYNDKSGDPDGAAGPKAQRRLQMSDLLNATFHELAAALQAKQVFPSQVFTLDQLKADRNFAPYIEKAEKHDLVKTELDKATADLKTAADKIKTLETDGQQARRSAELATAPTRLEEIAKRGTFTEKQVTFAKARLTDKVADLSDKGLTEFLNDQVAILTAAVGADARPGDTGKGAPAASGAGTTQNSDPGDLTKAANNPLLVEDIPE